MAANSVSGINIKIGADLTDLKTEVGKVGKTVEDGLKSGETPTKDLADRFSDMAIKVGKVTAKIGGLVIGLTKIGKTLGGFVKGALEDALKLHPDTQKKVDALKEAFDSVKTAFGEALLPLVDRVAPLVTQFLTNVADWIKENPDAARHIAEVAGAIGMLGSVLGIVQPIVALFGISMTTALGPISLVLLAIGGLVGLTSLFIEDMKTARTEVDETFKHMGDLSTDLQDKTEQAMAALMESGSNDYTISDGWMTGKDGKPIEAGVTVRWDVDSGSYVSLQEDIDAWIAANSETFEIDTSTLNENIEESITETETAADKAQEIMDQMQQAVDAVNTASDSTMTDALSGVNELLESAAFQQFANQPVSEEVGASWESFGESVTSASTGFQTLTQTLLGGEEGADPEATPLAMALQTISDKVRSVYGESKRLAEYWQDTFPSSVQAMLAVLCVTSTDEEGNVNAGGGNTLVTALGVVFDLFGDILTTSQQLAGFWTTEFVAASITMRNEAGPTGKAIMKMGAFASGAADQFYNMAAAILAVVDAMALLKGVKIGGSSGGSSGGGKKGGGKLKGNRDMTRASGGPVSDGLTYLVGENGPELFTPNRNGYIVPNEELSASRESITVNIGGNIYGESYLQNYVVGTLTTAIRQELKTAA